MISVGSRRKNVQRRLQAVWRGKAGRQRAIDQRRRMEELQRRERNALVMERVVRGHKGRERWEVHARLRELDDRAAPLKLRLKQLGEDRTKCIAAHEALKATLDELREVCE